MALPLVSPDRPALDALLRSPDIWRGRHNARVAARSTGHPALDRLLPGGGWPEASLIELLPAPAGIGELSLLLPSLDGPQAWVAPPHLPYAPALAAAGVSLAQLLILRPASGADALWAMEQVLRGGLDLVGWHGALPQSALRRLQLAAEDAGVRAFLFRPPAAADEASPAALRIALSRDARGLGLRILKCRGGRPAAVLLAAA